MINNFEEIKEAYFANKEDEKYILKYAKALMYQHENDEALKVFSSIKDEKNIDEANFYIARIYAFKGKLDQAIEIYKSLLETKYEGSCYYEISQLYIQKLKRLEKKSENKEYEAELKKMVYEYLHKSLKNKPTFKAYHSLATQLYFDNNFEESLNCCNIMLKNKDWTCEKTKNYYFVKFKMAENMYKLNKLDETKIILTELIDDGFKNLHQVYRLLGLIYIKENNKALAKEMIDKLNPDYDAYDFYYAYGKLCSDTQNFEEALEYFEKCENSFMSQQSNSQVAKIYFRIGDLEQSKSIYYKMMSGNSIDKNIACLGISRCERMARNYDEALTILEKMKNPNIQDKAEMLLEKFKIYYLTGNLTEAQKNLNELLDLNYHNYGRFEWAKLKMNQKCYDEALTEFKRIIEDKDSYEWVAVLHIAKIYKFIGNYEEAQKYLFTIPKTAYDAYYSAIGELIDCALSENDIESAEKYIKELENVKKQKDKDNFYYFSGLIAAAKGEIKESIELFEKVKLNDVKDYANSELAKIHWKYLNDIEKANMYIDKLVNSLAAVTKAQGYCLYGQMNIELGNYELAKEYLNYNIFNNNSKKEESLYLFAVCEELSKNYSKALQIYTDLNKNGKNSIYLFKLGKINLKLGNYDEARQFFNKIINDNKVNKKEALIKLAVIEYKTKNYEEALNILNGLEYSEKNNSIMIWKAKVYKALNNYDAAEKLLLAGLKSSNKKYALLELAILEYDKKNNSRALNYINQLISIGNKKEVAFGNYHKGKIFQQIGNFDKAKECFINILNVDNLSNYKIDENELDLSDLELDVDKNLILLELAISEEHLGNYQTAENYYSLIDNKSDNWKYAMNSLLNIKIRNNKYEDAEKIINDLETHNYVDYAMLGKGKLLSQKREYKKAHECFENVNFTEAIYLNAKAYFYEGEMEEAKRLFEHLLIINEESAYHARIYLSKIALINKDKQFALDIYEKYQDSNPEILLKLIYLNILDEKYYVAYKDALKLFELPEFKEKAITILIYLSKELNVILDKKYYGKNNYLRQQIASYDENLIRFFPNSSIKKYSDKVDGNIDVNLMIEMIKPMLVDSNLVYNNFLDTYVIPFEKIGINGENYLAVQTIPKTKKIIKMYPVPTKFTEFDISDEEEIIRKKSY